MINFNIDTCSNILNLSSSSNQNIQWSINGQNSNSVVLNQVLERKRQYDIYLIQNPNSICADTTSLSIDYDVQDVNRTIMIADAFSPNGDGINDILNVYIGDKCFLDEFKIYNRWGEIVYESNDPNKFYWDGKDLNNTVTDGVYILYLKSAESKIIRTVSLIK